MNHDASTQQRTALPLLARVTCPHCWEVFPPEHSLWITQHPDLLGDPRLGADHAQRFLPTRFNLAGAAIDSRGFACHGLACPKCHLAVPRALFEMPPFFVSILGAPSCGKSYFLASMTWQLRQVLPKQFGLNFSDADPELNYRLQEYESLQFLNPDPEMLVAIRKTETQGDLYDSVRYSDQAVSYPRPFVFTISPLKGHPTYGMPASSSAALCVYDNAGESFLPGGDTATNPVTRHLAQSRALFFLFDPTQDPRFRHACQGATSDPQMVVRTQKLDRENPVRQETILLEAAQRVRRYAGLTQNERHTRPLIVVVTKYDCWTRLLNDRKLSPPWFSNGKLMGVRLSEVDAVSREVRDLLWKHSPEVVAAAEGFASEVLFVPVSATGNNATEMPGGGFGFRPCDIRPVWADVPMLYTLARCTRGLVAYSVRKEEAQSPSAAAVQARPAAGKAPPHSNSTRPSSPH